MNVLRFWLIDTIVKVSSNHAPLALVNETPRGSLDADSELLFRASEDDKQPQEPEPVSSVPKQGTSERKPDVSVSEEDWFVEVEMAPNYLGYHSE